MNLYGKFIRHKRFMDVCFEAIYCEKIQNIIQLSGFYWNMGYVQSYRIDSKKLIKIEIGIEDIQDWEYTDPSLQSSVCLRDSEWKEIPR